MPSLLPQLSVRVSQATLDQLETVRAWLESERGYAVSQVEALRYVIAQGFKSAKKKPGKSSK